MRNVVLAELARKWTVDAQTPEPMPTDGSMEIEIPAAKAQACRETKRECADMLLTLIDVMPD